MQKKGAYKIIAEHRLVVQYFSGDIIMDDIIYLQKAISNELDYNPSFDIVVNFREANLLIKEKDVVDYVGFIREYTKIHGKRKAAYLTSKPNEVVVTTIFSMLIEDLPIQPKVFSTSNAIMNWLNRDKINNRFLSLVFNELKIQPNILCRY